MYKEQGPTEWKPNLKAVRNTRSCGRDGEIVADRLPHVNVQGLAYIFCPSIVFQQITDARNTA